MFARGKNMSYSAFTGIEYIKNGKWNCLVANVPEELKKLHYGFGARNGSMPFVNVDDFDCGNRDFSSEINKEINGPFTDVTHYKNLPEKELYFKLLGNEATEESWQKELEQYVPNPKGGYDVTLIDTDTHYTVLGVVTFDKLLEIRDRIFTEIKNKSHLYYSPKEALEYMLMSCENLKSNQIITDSIKDSINYIFSHSDLELKEKGFLTNPYAVEDYNDLDYYFYAVQYALNLVEHYVEEHNSKIDNYNECINEVNCRIIMWGC